MVGATSDILSHWIHPESLEYNWKNPSFIKGETSSELVIRSLFVPLKSWLPHQNAIWWYREGR